MSTNHRDSSAFFGAGVRAGGVADGEPGVRPDYHPGYFAAFLKDPEGNRVEAVFRQGAVSPGSAATRAGGHKR